MSGRIKLGDKIPLCREDANVGAFEVDTDGRVHVVDAPRKKP